MTGWCLWQAYNFGLSSTLMDVAAGKVTPRHGFYAMMQFTNHIRPGSAILSSSKAVEAGPCTVCVVVAYDRTRKMVVVVAANTRAAPASHSFDFKALKTVVKGTKVNGWETISDGKTRHARINGLTVDATSKVTYALKAKSITTLEIGPVAVAV